MLEDLKRGNVKKKSKLTQEEIVNILLDHAANNNELLNSIIPCSLVMTPNQLTIYNELRDNRRSSEYIKLNYDFIVPSNELKFNECLDMYMGLAAKKERLQHIERFVKDYDDAKNPDLLTDRLLDNLQSVKFKQSKYLSETDILFFESEVGEFKKAEKYINAEPIPVGIPYYDNLENVNKFNYPNSLGMMLGRSGSGKTFILLNSAIESIKKGYKVLFIYTEMSKPEMSLRIIPFLTEGEVTYDDITSGNMEKYLKLRPSLVEKYGDKLTMIGPTQFQGSLKTYNVRNYIERFKPEIVYIDYFQKMHDSDNWKNPITQDLKKYCIEYNTNIILSAMASDEDTFKKFQMYKDKNKITNPERGDISKNKKIIEDADWMVSAATERIEDINAMIYNFQTLKGRQGQSRVVPEKYIMVPYKGIFMESNQFNKEYGGRIANGKFSVQSL